MEAQDALAHRPVDGCGSRLCRRSRSCVILGPFGGGAREPCARPRPRLSSQVVRRERGLQLIVAYKVVKGGLGIALATVLLTCAILGIHGPFLGIVSHLRHHTGAWSLELAKLVVRASTRRGLWVVAVALLGDGIFTLIEGWALVHGSWWGPWLVVVSTSAFVPFEIASLVRHIDAIRACVLIANACIVAYLAGKALRERREAMDAKRRDALTPRADFHRPRETQ
jgi:uncharacterized membrane protein (DUF2068 family)